MSKVVPPDGKTHIPGRQASAKARKLGVPYERCRVGTRKWISNRCLPVTTPVFDGILVLHEDAHKFAVPVPAEDPKAALEAAITRARAMGDYETVRDLERERDSA